jgi:hypothetical protein
MPAEMRENGRAVARAAGQLPSEARGAARSSPALAAHRADPAPPGTARHTVPVSCREGRCAVLGRCVLTAPAVRRRCREAREADSPCDGTL